MHSHSVIIRYPCVIGTWELKHSTVVTPSVCFLKTLALLGNTGLEYFYYFFLCRYLGFVFLNRCFFIVNIRLVNRYLIFLGFYKRLKRSLLCFKILPRLFELCLLLLKLFLDIGNKVLGCHKLIEHLLVIFRQLGYIFRTV